MSERSSDYQVGYGKPPRHSRFQKSRSGNPKGRPQGSVSLPRLANRILMRKSGCGKMASAAPSPSIGQEARRSGRPST
jgi:hypothetical protein